jgi:hypothetical protein
LIIRLNDFRTETKKSLRMEGSFTKQVTEIVNRNLPTPARFQAAMTPRPEEEAAKQKAVIVGAEKRHLLTFRFRPGRAD